MRSIAGVMPPFSPGRSLNLVDEMTHLVNSTLGEKKNDVSC